VSESHIGVPEWDLTTWIDLTPRERVREREKQRQNDRQADRGRQTDRHADEHTFRFTDKHPCREGERH
jgi:hypothetical protein